MVSNWQSFVVWIDQKSPEYVLKLTCSVSRIFVTSATNSAWGESTSSSTLTCLVLIRLCTQFIILNNFTFLSSEFSYWVLFEQVSEVQPCSGWTPSACPFLVTGLQSPVQWRPVCPGGWPGCVWECPAGPSSLHWFSSSACWGQCRLFWSESQYHFSAVENCHEKLQ